MLQPSLHDIMNDIASQGFAASCADADGCRSFDPLLAALHKRYLDARAVHACLAEQFGADNDMAELAADRMDSALSAYEARLIELRQNGVMRRAALARLKRMKADMVRREREKKSAEHAYQRKMQAYYAWEGRAERARREAEESFNNFAILWQMLRLSAADTSRRLRLAGAFMQASATDHVSLSA